MLDELVMEPCIPGDWKGFTATRLWRGAHYTITVENPEGVEKGVAALFIDGVRAEKIPPFPKGETHAVRVVMGERSAQA